MQQVIDAKLVDLICTSENDLLFSTKQAKLVDLICADENDLLFSTKQANLVYDAHMILNPNHIYTLSGDRLTTLTHTLLWQCLCILSDKNIRLEILDAILYNSHKMSSDVPIYKLLYSAKLLSKHYTKVEQSEIENTLTSGTNIECGFLIAAVQMSLLPANKLTDIYTEVSDDYNADITRFDKYLLAFHMHVAINFAQKDEEMKKTLDDRVWKSWRVKCFFDELGNSSETDVLCKPNGLLSEKGCNVDDLFDMLIRQFIIPKMMECVSSSWLDRACISARKCAEKRIKQAKDSRTFTIYMYALAVMTAGYKFGEELYAELNIRHAITLHAYHEITTRFNRNTYLLLLLSEYVAAFVFSRLLRLTHRDMLEDLFCVLYNNKANDNLMTINHSYVVDNYHRSTFKGIPRTPAEVLNKNIMYFAKFLARKVPDKFIDTVDELDYTTGKETQCIIFFPIFMPGDDLPHDRDNMMQIICSSKHNMFTGELTDVVEIQKYNEQPEILQRRKEHKADFDAWAATVLQELISVAV